MAKKFDENSAGQSLAFCSMSENFHCYKNFIVLGLVLGLLGEICYFLQRFLLAYTNFDEFAPLKKELLAMFIMGFRLDMRAVCVVIALIMLLGYLALFSKMLFKARLKMTAGGGAFDKKNLSENDFFLNFCLKFDKFIYKFTLFFATLSSFVFALSAFVNFYYFRTYHTKIDIFIFGLKDDDTAAILKIMWQDYPVLIILLASTCFAWLCLQLSKRILNSHFMGKNSAQFKLNSSKLHTNQTKTKFAPLLSFVLNLTLIALVFIGIRGSVSAFPLREDEHHIAANALINHISTNPIIAFSWALSHYKEQDSFKAVNLDEFEALQSELFPVFQHNSQKSISKSPNVVVVLMESLGTNMLSLDNALNFDLLMGFRAHFEAGKVVQNSSKPQNDFVFMNFLSSTNGTAGSFASLFFLSPNANISLGLAKDKKLALTPFAVYKNAGYEVIYITSGNRSWQNFGDYATTLGADAVYDSNFLMSRYPQSKQNANIYGVLDEFAYKFAFELLQKATKPTFIAILTTSNHPPYPTLPQHFSAPKFDFKDKMRFFKHNNAQKTRASAEIFAYSNNAFGEFIGSIKHSELKNSTIIAASGDHKNRDLIAFESTPLNHAVPFYLYVPSAYTKDFDKNGFAFNPATIGSHKDIFPTLYALSLNEYDFLTLGGRNLFDKNALKGYNFAVNSELWLDESGIYPANSAFGYKYTLKNGFITQSNESFKLPKNKAEFLQKYQKLDNLQLNYRVLQP